MATFRFTFWRSTQQKLIPECWDLKAVMGIGGYNGRKWLARGSNAGVDFLLSILAFQCKNTYTRSCIWQMKIRHDLRSRRGTIVSWTVTNETCIVLAWDKMSCSRPPPRPRLTFTFQKSDWGWGAKDCFDLAQDRGEVVDSCECGDEPLGSIKWKEFLDWPRSC
jgi:hypothetical protein